MFRRVSVEGRCGVKSMISPKGFEEAWTYSPLAKASPDLVKNLRISVVEKQFLIEAGLPEKTIFSFGFHDVKLGMPRLVDVDISDKNEVPSSFSRYRLMAHGEWVPYICLDEQANGRIVSISFSDPTPVRFVNSNILCFAEFLLTYMVRYADIAKKSPVNFISDEDTRKALHYLRRKYRTVDAPAVADKESFWSLILNEIRDGTL